MRQLFIFAILGGLLLVVQRHPDQTDLLLSNASKNVTDTLHVKEGLAVTRQVADPGRQAARQGGISLWSDIDNAFDVATKSNILETIQTEFLSAVSSCSEWTTNALNYLTGDFGHPTSVVTRPS